MASQARSALYQQPNLISEFIVNRSEERSHGTHGPERRMIQLLEEAKHFYCPAHIYFPITSGPHLEPQRTRKSPRTKKKEQKGTQQRKL
jgi:hypothetical protein